MAHEIINNFRAKISIEFCCTNNYHLVWISVLNFFSHLAGSSYLKSRFAEKATKNCRNFPFIFDTKGVSVCKPRVVFHEKNRNSLFKFLCITIHNKTLLTFEDQHSLAARLICPCKAATGGWRCQLGGQDVSQLRSQMYTRSGFLVRFSVGTVGLIKIQSSTAFPQRIIL